MEPRSSPGPASSGTGGISPEVIVADRRWHALVRGSGRVVVRAARLGGGAGSVLLTTDDVVRRLNARHRGENHATNVLTFEAGPGGDGDIVLALGVVRREAAAAGRRPVHHLAHLVLHGALHLRGHDHHGAGEARRMEMREASLLRRMGVPNPWRMGAGGVGAGGVEAGGVRGGVGPRADGVAGSRTRACGPEVARTAPGLRGMGLASSIPADFRGWAVRRWGVRRGDTKTALLVTRRGTEQGFGRGRVLPGGTR